MFSTNTYPYNNSYSIASVIVLLHRTPDDWFKAKKRVEFRSIDASIVCTMHMCLLSMHYPFMYFVCLYIAVNMFSSPDPFMYTLTAQCIYALATVQLFMNPADLYTVANMVYFDSICVLFLIGCS